MTSAGSEPAGKLRVCIADDHRLMLDGVSEALGDVDDIEVVGMTERGAEVIALVDAMTPDIVLLDLHMPDVDGLTCLRSIRKRHPEIKVVMLSGSEEPAEIAEALRDGASAYIGKRINGRDLASALRQVAEGTVFHRAGETEDAGAAAKREGAGAGLTARESAILAAVTRGLGTKAISRELWISEKTVKFHLTNIYRKLGVHNRTAAIRYAYEHKLIDPPRDATST